MRRLGALLLASALAGLAATVEPASACSCAIGDPRTMLAQFDAAFVGKLLERRATGSTATFTFEVERAVKGELGPRVDVVTAPNGAACGIETVVGRRIGVFLIRRGATWTSNLCLQIPPQELLEAARPLPRAPGGPAALIVTGRFGTARTLALDERGRTVAYGRGRGEALTASICPGSQRLAEVARADGKVLVAVRGLRTFRIMREIRVPLAGALGPGELICRDQMATDVVLFLQGTDGFAAGARLVSIRRNSVRTIWRGPALHAGFAGKHAFLSSGAAGSRLLRVDVTTGRSVSLGRVPPYAGPFVPAPDGRRLAAVAYSAPSGLNPAPSRLVLVQLKPRFRVRTAALGKPNVSGDVLWLSNARVACFPSASGDVDAVRVFDGRLRAVSRWRGWRARRTVLFGKRALGLGYRGDLFVADPVRGRPRLLRTLPGPIAHRIAVVPGAPRVKAVQPGG
jgi:hypothetical protein